MERERWTVGIWQAIPRLVVLHNHSIIGPSTLLYLSHPFAYKLTRSNIFYFTLPLAVLPACCHCLVYFNMDLVWDFLYKVTSFLRGEGMSSDESGQEGLGPPYYVRIREWQSRELLPYLQMVDQDRKQVNCYGNNRPGKAARE